MKSNRLEAPVSVNPPVLFAGGDRRSTERSDEILEVVAADPRDFAELILGLWSGDAMVRVRAADAAEKVTRKAKNLLRLTRRNCWG